MAHKEYPFHLIKAEQILLDHAMRKFAGEVTGIVKLNDRRAIIAEVFFRSQKKLYVGDVREMISTLDESDSTSVAESNFGITSSFAQQPFRDNEPRQ